MKKPLLIMVAFLAFASSGLLAHFYNRNDAMSLRFILWKKGLHPYPSDIIFHALLSDGERDLLIRGKTKEEIKTIFHSVYETSINDYQRMYDKELSGRDYLWLGEDGVIIFFKDGLAYQISIMKG